MSNDDVVSKFGKSRFEKGLYNMEDISKKT